MEVGLIDEFSTTHTRSIHEDLLVISRHSSSSREDVYHRHIVEIEEDEVIVERFEQSTTNGVYLVRTNSSRLGIFKPDEEEAKYLTDGITPVREGIVHGDSCIKEVAAFRLDHDGFSGVPHTVLAALPTPDGSWKRGSMQRYVENIGSMEDYSSSKIDVERIHAIGLLDLRLYNLDRHMGNILAVEDEVEELCVVPIDHGFILPDFRNMGGAWFDWMYWDQASVPFSDRTQEYIASINILEDAKELSHIGVRPQSVVTYVMCTMVVKECVKRGMTLQEIGSLMQRDMCEPDLLSPMEDLVQLAMEERNMDEYDGSAISLLDLNRLCGSFVNLLLEFLNRDQLLLKH